MTKAHTSKPTSKSRVTRAGAKSSSAKTAKKKAPKSKPRVTRVEVKSSSAKTAKKKTPKYRLSKFKPLPRKGANLGTELIRLGQSVGGVDLELPTRSRPYD